MDFARASAILANSIHDSGGLGIELTENGNNDQAFPDLTSATLTNAGTVITGTLTSTPDTAFTLEFFANDVCNPSGYGEGQYLLGDATVTTDDNGQATFTVTVGSSSPGQFIAATATDPINDTSAFSACVQLTTASSVVGLQNRVQAGPMLPMEAAPASSNSNRTAESAHVSCLAVPDRLTVNAAAAPVRPGPMVARTEADTDRFWQDFGRDPLTAI